MKKQKPYNIYNAHIPTDLWDKMTKALKRNPQLNDRRNSYNRIICKALNEYFDKGNQHRPDGFRKITEL